MMGTYGSAPVNAVLNTTSIDFAFYNVDIQHNEVCNINCPGKVANSQQDVRS